ncbi:protein NDNF-like, partial [Silurus asotus]
RLHFTLRKKTPALTLTVSPCSGSVEWSLTAHSLKDKTAKEHYWSFKKSEPEVWWRKSASEKTLYTYSGSAVETYMAPALHPVSVYTLRITATQEDTHTQVYLHEGFTPLGVFPELPFEPQVHVLGVGMSSVTLTWSSSPSVIKSLTTHTHAHTHTTAYVYCVTMNRKHNYRSLCAAQEEKGGMKDEWNKGAVDKLDKSRERVCVCEEVESVCTVSELQPNTLYYFDVFVVDKINSTSAAYTGTVAHTHAESRTHADLHTPPHTEGVTPLREGQVQWVTLSSGAGVKQSFRFRPRGGQKNGLLTLLSCNDTHTLTHTLSVSVSARGNEVTSQEVGDQLVQVWLQGYASYLIQLRLSARHTPAAQRETVCVKMQASSAFHRRGAPALPHTLHIKSFNTLRTCSSVTLAWMGTEERGLYCLYRRRVEEGGETGGHGVIRDQCLAPESRPPDQRVLCKYFQELDARRAVTTATVGGLEAETLYIFDIYLMRRWALPVKYHSKMVRTRRDC